MTPRPSLREVFDGIAGGSQDPHAALEAAGYGDLEPHLVDQAIVNYAHGAPVEVAEHLSPFVVPRSGVPHGDEGDHGAPDTSDGLAMLSSAPAPADHAADHHDGDPYDTAPDAHHGLGGADHLDAAHTSAISFHPDPADHSAGHSPETHDGSAPTEPTDLSFGAGERGTGEHLGASEADHATAADVGHPDLVDGAPAGSGWLDVTGAQTESHDFGATGDDWTHPHHDLDEPGLSHPGLDEGHHDAGGALDGGTGA